MGRKKKSIDRGLLPDAKYNSIVVSKFVNRMMWQGKKSIAIRIVHGAMDNLRAKTEKDPLEVFLKALDNVKPVVEVKSRRVGGATYQVPIEIREARREAEGDVVHPEPAEHQGHVDALSARVNPFRRRAVDDTLAKRRHRNDIVQRRI